MRFKLIWEAFIQKSFKLINFIKPTKLNNMFGAGTGLLKEVSIFQSFINPSYPLGSKTLLRIGRGDVQKHRRLPTTLNHDQIGSWPSW